MKKHRLMNHQKYFRTLCFGLSFLTAACTNESPLSTEPAEWPKTSISIQATVDTKAANEPETAADNGTITRAGGLSAALQTGSLFENNRPARGTSPAIYRR